MEPTAQGFQHDTTDCPDERGYDRCQLTEQGALLYPGAPCGKSVDSLIPLTVISGCLVYVAMVALCEIKNQ